MNCDISLEQTHQSSRKLCKIAFVDDLNYTQCGKACREPACGDQCNDIGQYAIIAEVICRLYQKYGNIEGQFKKVVSLRIKLFYDFMQHVNLYYSSNPLDTRNSPY